MAIKAPEQEEFYLETEVSGIDTSLLMSMLDESQAEHCDDERLTVLIQSLQAEIDLPVATDRNGSSDDEQLNLEDYIDEHPMMFRKPSENSSRADELDYFSNWVDMEMEMEMEMETSTSSPCDDITSWSWCMENGVGYMDAMIEYDNQRDYSYYSQLCPRVPSEEFVCSSSLWHETPSNLYV